MIYTIEVTVEVTSHRLRRAYSRIQAAMKSADIVFIDAQDVAQREEEDDEDPEPWGNDEA